MTILMISSGGFWDIRRPINTAIEAIISVKLLSPSAFNAWEVPMIANNQFYTA